MTAPVPDNLDDIGADVYKRLGTIYEGGPGATAEAAADGWTAYTESFLKGLDAFRDQLRVGWR